jgi:hypothetical protein
MLLLTHLTGGNNMSLELLTYGLEWFSSNYYALILVLIVITPILAITVLGYMVHVLAKLTERKK